MSILLILGIAIPSLLVVTVLYVIFSGGQKRRVRVSGPAFPTPVEFTVIDNCKWLAVLGAGGITLSKNKVRLRRKFDWALMRNPSLVVHEARHIVQARKLGILYLPTYFFQSIKAGFKKRSIPLEAEAYSAEPGASFVVL